VNLQEYCGYLKNYYSNGMYNKSKVFLVKLGITNLNFPIRNIPVLICVFVWVAEGQELY